MQKSTIDQVSSNHKSITTPYVPKDIKLPKYMEDTYWWAYVHPTAVRIFERQWLVNFILWGNFARLRDAALDDLGKTIDGTNLQVACVYGDFSQQLTARLKPESKLHIIDIAPIQLENVHKKLNHQDNVYLHHQDSSCLDFDDDNFDNIVVFFLLHEQPEPVRAKTVEEVTRVIKAGGKIVFIDYHCPHKFNPFRYIMLPILHWLEPFALGVWKKEIIEWVPKGLTPKHISKEIYFGGLYQKVVMTF